MKFRIIQTLLLITLSLSFGTLVNGQIVLQRCDFTTSWTSSSSLAIDTFDKKEGVGSLRFTGSGTDWFKKSFSQTKSGIDATGYISFWLYVSDVTAFTAEDGQVEIGSGGAADTDEYSWPVSSMSLSDGWNEVILSISSATAAGAPDLDAINYFRIYQPLSGAINGKIDFIKFTATATPVVSDMVLDVKTVDRTTLDGKVMFGYQGWFGTPDDGSVSAKWFHWGNLSTGSGNVGDLSIDMWYDDRESDPDERMATGYQYPDGRPARVYSAYNRKTVMRHMKWLRDYDLDGVMLQRFVYEIDDARLKDFRDSVATYVKDGSERYGRTFIIMWDGLDRANTVEKIIADWKHLVDDLKITESPAYLNHRGRPLISLWGYSVREEASVSDLNELIEFFHNSPEEKYRASIKVGCNQDWINRSEWRVAFRKVEVISPWAVGRYGNESGFENFADKYMTPAQEYCDQWNMDFMPVNFAGFSWYNLQDASSEKNKIPRNGGKFYWSQMRGNLSRGAKMQYVAMFDEVDESTAMFKLAENVEQVPDKGYWLTLDADGDQLPSDWYLRSTTLATQAMRGETDNRAELGTPDDGLDVFSIMPNHETCSQANGQFVLGYPSTDSNPIMEFSIDGGQNYAYKTPASTSELTVSDLEAGLYNIWIRYEDGSFPTDLGDVAIVDVEPKIDIAITDATCLPNGALNILVDDNPYMGAIDISLDDGATYAYQVEEGVYSSILEGLDAGTYQVWVKWAANGCPTNYGEVEIKADFITPTAKFKLYDEIITSAVCLGSPVVAEAAASAPGTWSWSGPNGFSASTRIATISEDLKADEAGVYTVSFTSDDNCVAETSITLEVSNSTTPAIDFTVNRDDEALDPGSNSFCEGDVLILEGLPKENDWDWQWTGPNNFVTDKRSKTLTGNAKPELTGNYTVKFTDPNGCVNLITKTVEVKPTAECSITALDDNDFNKIASIYPNPATTAFNIELQNTSSVDLEIRDIRGRLIHMEQLSGSSTHTIDMAGLDNGVYLLKLKTQEGRLYSTRIIKE